MSIFDDMAEAEILAADGQRQFAAILAKGFARMLRAILDRCIPNGTMAPW